MTETEKDLKRTIEEIRAEQQTEQSGIPQQNQSPENLKDGRPR